MKSGGFQVKSTQNLINSDVFNKNYSVWWMQERGYDLGFHEIWGHSPLHAPPPKLKSFCWNIWFYKVLGGFSPEICRISWMWAFAWWSSIGLSIERPTRPHWPIFSNSWTFLSFMWRCEFIWDLCDIDMDSLFMCQMPDEHRSTWTYFYLFLVPIYWDSKSTEMQATVARKKLYMVKPKNRFP